MNTLQPSSTLSSRLWVWLIIALLLNIIILFTIIYLFEQTHQYPLISKIIPKPRAQPQIIKMLKTKAMNAPKGNANQNVSPVPQVAQQKQQQAAPKKQEQKPEEAVPPKAKEADVQQKSFLKKATPAATPIPIAKTPPKQKPQRKKYYEERPAPDTQMPTLADVASGFLYHQKQQEQQVAGISNGNVNGDLAMMKYASYFKTLKKHLQTHLNITMNQLSPGEYSSLTQKRLQQTLFFIEWDRAGGIVQLQMTRSSGDSLHDYVAKAIIMAALPLPAIPPSLNVNTLSVPWGFALTPGHATDMNSVPTSFNYT